MDLLDLQCVHQRSPVLYCDRFFLTLTLIPPQRTLSLSPLFYRILFNYLDG